MPLLIVFLISVTMHRMSTINPYIIWYFTGCNTYQTQPDEELRQVHLFLYAWKR